MDVLVTGGAGFIGSHLVALLVERGADVRVLERPGIRFDHLPLDHIDAVFADVRDCAAVARAVRGCPLVFHLAANPNLWTHRRGQFTQVNYHGTVHVLDAALEAGARRILHTSTESILTRARQHCAIREDQDVRLEDALGPYCRSKLLAERYAFRLARSGAPVVIVNPTIPIGPGDRGRSPPTQMILDFCRGRRREYLDGELNLIDVRDVAEGMIRAMGHGRPGRRYLLGAENMTIRELFTLLAELTGLPAPTRRVPYPVALAAAHVSEFVADVLDPPHSAGHRHRRPSDATGHELRRNAEPGGTGAAAETGAGGAVGALGWYREVGWIGVG